MRPATEEQFEILAVGDCFRACIFGIHISDTQYFDFAVC